MEKLSAFFKKLWEKFKAFSKIIRITIIVAIVAVLVAIVIAIASASKVKYATLFYDLDSADAQTVMASLDEQSVAYKVEGGDILVDATQVDKLRLSLASNLSSSSKGYELMDNSSSFGMTDEEFQIYKIRMIQGELERSIKTLDVIKNCKVMITPAQDSVFVQSATEGNASIVVELNPGVKLSQENVQAIVAMVSMGTENIPKENIAVVDTNGNLLTKDSANSSSTDGSNTVTSETITSQYDQEKNYEDKIAKKVVDLLEPIVGPNNVQAQVNADLDFDSKKISEYDIDPNDVLISQETENSYNSANSGDTTSESPVDNNMSNTIQDSNGDKSSSSTEHQINNYDHSNKKTETVKAPGEVRRLTVSVFINGKLDQETQKAFEDAIKAATGYDATRQDSISVVGMNFDTTVDDQTQAQIDKYNAAQKAAERNKLIKYIVLGVVALLIIGTVIVIVLKKRNSDEEEQEEENILDVVVGDDTEPVEYEPIDFKQDNEKTHIENEIKKYATEKPDQVAEIVKSWLNDSER
ncbi:flagellar M-ring protein FliF [Clostridium sp. MSJ-8]|uniref:flagellar basal-body MS-ring/collar protein FliF n=1 Tax=Clostridium sp. MSJ-8 TaxID=2841510 RepID=UPI001C0F37E3|nr:flagellar basal-body MS-ring/collar protein FliF [Clostridium sp. MSJ-8]MBU5488402.1 flagellar M-ring protein FliF [Clostridium sp. MSJ-8]